MSQRTSIALLVGLILIVAGVGFLSWQIALIVAGVCIVGLAVTSEF